MIRHKNVHFSMLSLASIGLVNPSIFSMSDDDAGGDAGPDDDGTEGDGEGEGEGEGDED